MAKQLNVDLNFTANTGQAKQQILELQSILSKISVNGSMGVDSTKIKEASAAAKELSIHLNNAFNANTGKLDLSKLDKSLKTSSTNVTELSTKLLNAGVQGQQAFVKLAQTISAADRPVVTLSSKLNGLFTTLKNTVRWQLSSSILHGFMGAYQQAIGYVKDLNESLTDIRIVTGKSIEDMSRFATEANKVAKVLSTTTNEYAKASLIFFQQGLNEEEVAKRAEVTIKMANVTGQSAQIISNQLTAVWNNFYDGSKSLEYYADVMTALGAATASSTDEIAGGLEKFAAIGQTIGLSYEYAASALATITANTRQSEEVVGTALKTIFARIQGLNLGETLDDGTTLNQYSEALQKVGINIFDQVGKLKDMDNILDEMGAKWETLNKAQQTALAQTVAGVRQYNQLISLMDNWNSGDSDSMQANLTTAYGAEGVLQNQADIYAESWEAARDRVKASLETIYSQLLDDEFFIDISNGFSHLLNSIGAFIEGIGGIKTILGTIFAFFLSSVSTKLEPALQQLKQNFEIIFTGSSKSAKKMAEEMQAVSTAVLNDPKNKLSESDRFTLESSTKMSAAKNKMFDVEKNLSPLEKQQYEMELQVLEIEQKNISALIEQNIKKKEAVSLAEKELKLAKDKVLEAKKLYDEEAIVDSQSGTRESEEEKLHGNYIKAQSKVSALQSTPVDPNNEAAVAAITQASAEAERAKQAWLGHMEKTEEARFSLEKLGNTLKETYEREMETTGGALENSTAFISVSDACSEYITRLSNMSQEIGRGRTSIEDLKTGAMSMKSEIEMATGGLVDFSKEFVQIETATNKDELAKGFDALIEKMKTAGIHGKDLEKALNELGQGKYTKAMSSGFSDVAKKTQSASKATRDYEKSVARLKKAQDELNKKFDAFNPQHKAKALESFAKAGAGLGKLASSITMIRSAFIALNNEDLSFGEKLTTVTMSLTMAIPMLTSGLTTLKTGLAGLNSVFGMTMAVQKLAGLTMLQQATNTEILTGKITAQQIAQRTGLSLDQAEVLLNQRQAAAILLEAQAEGTLGGAKMNTQIAEKLGISVKQAGLIISRMKQGASLEEAAAEQGVTIAKSKGIVASIANTAAKLAETVGTKMKTIADKGETAGIWAKVAAYIAEQAAAWPVLVVTLLIVAAIAALATIVVLLVKGIQALVAAYNADEIAAEKAETAAKNLGEAYNECKQEYEDMIAAMENYKSARDALDSLTKGTEEYREALKEANRQAMELINQYGLIEGQDYEWQGDELVIKDSAMSRVRSEKEDEVDKAYAASQMAGAEAKRLRAKADLTEMKRDIRDDNGLGDGDLVWKTIGTSIATSLLPGIGPIIGGAIGGAYLVNEFSDAAKMDAAIEKAVEESKTNANLFDTKEAMAKALDIDLNDTELIDALWANRDSIQQLSADMNAATQAEKLAAQNAANEIMSESGYDKTEAGKMALEAGGEIYQQMYGDAYDKYLADAKDRGWFNTGTDASKAAFEEYAKQAGLDQLKNFEVTNYKGDGTVEYKYIDEQGQEQTALATAEEIAATLAAAEAANSLEGALSALRTEITNLNLSENEADHALAEFISKGNLEGTTKAEYDAIASEIGDVTSDADIEAYLDKKFGDGKDGKISDETAKKYGYENADAMVQAMKASLEIEWEVPDGVADEIADKFTLGAAAKIQSAYEKMGEQGGQAFVDTVNTIASGADWDALSPEDQTAMLDEIANIDWTSWDAGEQAIAIAERYGIAIDATSEAWKNNIDAMRDATNALPDLQAMREEFEKIQEITSDIDLGSILSEDDYNTLVKYNSELSKYFSILSDGSAQFIGDKLDFQQQIKETHQKELQDAMAAYKDRYFEIQAQLQHGADAVGGADKLDSFRDTENYVGDDGNNYYKGANVNKQLDFLESQGYDQAKLDEWRLDLEDGSTTVQVLEDIASAVNTTADAYGALGTEAETMQGLIQGTMNEIALSAESAEERMAMLKEGTINLEAYGYAAMAAHNAEKWEDLDPSEVEDYADAIMEAADASALLSDELKENEEAAEDVALYTKKMNKGIDTLADGFEDWSDILQKSDKASEEYATAMADMKHAMSDVLGVGEEWLSNDFILNNLEDIEKAANGDADAIDRLAIAAGKDILVNMELVDEGVRDELYALHDQLAAEIPSIEVGATLDDGDFLSKAAQIVETAGMSVEQANAYFRSLGFEPHFETKEVTTETKKPKIRTHTDYAISMSSIDTGFGTIKIPTFDSIQTSWNEGYTTVPETIEVPSLTTDGGTPNFTLTRTNSGAMNNYSSSNSGGKSPGSGGGGSKPKVTSDSRQKKSDVVERYKEITDQLERTNHLMNKNTTLAEGLWGEARSAKMRKNIELQKQEVALLGQKLAETEAYLNLDRQELNSAAAVLGVNLDINEDGIVTNIESVQEELWKKREALLDSFGVDMDEDEEAQLEALDKYIERFNDAYSLYEETRQENMSTEEEMLEAQLAAQELMFNELNQSLEENISLIEQDLALVEYYLSKVEDDFYGMAEAAALMVGSLSSANPGEGGQLGAYLDTLEAQKKYKEELDTAYANGDINQAQYIEGLMNCQDAMMDALSSLNELDKTMKGYYGETLEAAQEELSKYTDMMEHHSEVLEHYSNLLELIGASKDWERMKTVLEAQVSVAENAAAVSKANYEMLAQEAADKKAAWDALGKGLGDKLTYEESVIKQQWLDAQAAADEAQNQMLDDAAAWAESLKSLLETELAELADILNESLSGEFGSLDNMMTAMERANSLQEEYLTTTNQVYEINKLMHTAQQEIDKTTNSVAKRRLKQYIDETEQLQNKNKLSQFELDIQKAKYDLLVAEIALEEAQQAKSTVRLQRDSEGNFGYVYTADQNAVAEAEQQLADAQNALYNIGLEGANKYAESYTQTIQEMNDAVTELTEKWQNGEITSKEEYQRQMLALEEYYGEKLMQYSELHSIALQTDSRVAADAWTKDFAHMTTQTQKWMQNVDVYVQGVEASMDRYQRGIKRVEEYAGLDLDSLKKKTENIKNENKDLADSITKKDGLLDAMKKEIEQVSNLTTEYSKLRIQIQGTIDDYEDLLRRMGIDIDTAAAGKPPLGSEDNEDPGTTDPGTTDPGTTDSGTTDPGDTGAKTISVGGKINAGNAPIYNYAGDTSGEHQYFSNDPVYKVLKENGDWIQVRHHKLSSGITGWFKKSDVTAMNTGGYTGDWAGSYGKLAFLHQKELVLNAKDTENLLASMDILDKIISTIDLYSSSAQLGGLLSSPRYGGFDSEPLQQNVHIEASFPSVTDHNEIEDALNNLINRASQYAHRN